MQTGNEFDVDEKNACGFTKFLVTSAKITAIIGLFISLRNLKPVERAHYFSVNCAEKRCIF